MSDLPSTTVAERPSLYHGHRFPREVTAHAVRLYLRFALSFREVEELLAGRDPSPALRATHYGS